MWMQLVVHDFLAGVKSVIAGKYIAYGTGYAKKQHAFMAKQLYAEEHRCQWAVYHAAEQGNHADSGAQRRVKA